MTGSPLETLSENAYQAIRDKILRGGFPLGASLSRRKLAKLIGTSQLTISVALRRLESEGLVETKARAGTRVRVPGPEDIRDSYILREALETQAARLFVKHATVEQKRELRRMAERTDVLFNRCTAGDTDAEFLYEVHSFHLEFHMRIAQAAGSQALMHALERNQVLIFNWLFDVAVQHQQRPPRSHRELAEVLCTADAEAADRAMRKHIQYGLDEIVGGITARTGARWRAGVAGEISETREPVSL